MTKLKIAASTYLNSAPLIYSFLKGTQKDKCTFLGDTAPAHCADLLKQDFVDIALIPVIEYQSMKRVCLIPDIAVASKNYVQSVILVAKKPIIELKTVSLDTSSRTSASLVKIILEKFYNIKPNYNTASPNLTEMLKQSDAALIIGDPAIKISLETNKEYQSYDLAQEWCKFTGLPFVFACWAVNKKNLRWSDNESRFLYDRLTELFLLAKEEGLSKLKEISEEYSKTLELDSSLLLNYLTNYVNYDLDKENLLGLELFYKLAYESGLIKQKQPIKFLDML